MPYYYACRICGVILSGAPFKDEPYLYCPKCGMKYRIPTPWPITTLTFGSVLVTLFTFMISGLILLLLEMGVAFLCGVHTPYGTLHQVLVFTIIPVLSIGIAVYTVVWFRRHFRKSEGS